MKQTLAARFRTIIDQAAVKVVVVVVLVDVVVVLVLVDVTLDVAGR